MWSSRGIGGGRAWLRGLLALLGLVGAIWSVGVLPSFWTAIPVNDLGARILADEKLRPVVVGDAFARINAQGRDPMPQAKFMQAVALITLRAAEESMRAGGSDNADRLVELAQDRVRGALSISPTEAFLWLTVYSLETTRNGFDPAAIACLRQSYLTGPHEGWVALRRYRQSLAVFSILDQSLQADVLAEFAAIVDSGFVEDAEQALTTVGWEHRARLAASLERVDMRSRENLAQMLSSDGVKLAIPGVEASDRPWK